MMRYEARQWTDFGEHSDLKIYRTLYTIVMLATETYFIDLGDDSVQYFALERSENDCLIFDWIHNEALSRLYDTGTDLINGCNCYDESILSGACALHFCVKFLFHCFHQLRAEIFGMQQYFVLEGDLSKVCLVKLTASSIAVR